MPFLYTRPASANIIAPTIIETDHEMSINREEDKETPIVTLTIDTIPEVQGKIAKKEVHAESG
mgnify:CR=1 FL=1